MRHELEMSGSSSSKKVSANFPHAIAAAAARGTLSKGVNCAGVCARVCSKKIAWGDARMSGLAAGRQWVVRR
jgi:hypothetical protein